MNLCRRLVEIDALSYEPRLAVALVDLSNVLGAVQDYARSLAALHEGMELYARLHAEAPERALPGTWLPPGGKKPRDE